jgi:hypothetical protein
MIIVMRRRPPTATKPMPISGACALVVAIAMPRPRPILRQLLPWIVSLSASQECSLDARSGLKRGLCCSHRCVPVASVCSKHFLGQKRARMMRRGPYDPTFTTTIGQSETVHRTRCASTTRSWTDKKGPVPRELAGLFLLPGAVQ